MFVRIFLIFILSISSNILLSQEVNEISTVVTSNVPNKELEVAMGIDVIEKIDFDYNTKITIGNESLLKLVLIPTKREIIFKGLKPGRTSVTIRDNVGDVRLQYTVVITASGKSNIVSELRELIGDDSIKEIYVHTTQERGREQFFVENYQPPTENFIDCDTTEDSEFQSYRKLLQKLDL